MDAILVLPFLIPFLGALGCLINRQSLDSQKWIAVVSTTLLFVVSLYLCAQLGGGTILVLRPGNWPVPMGIVLVADLFSGMMLAISNLIGCIVLIYALADVSRAEQERFFFPLYLLLLMGVNGSFLAGDIFNLYVWFEVMLLASFVLLALGRKPEQLEGALKYVTLNLFASMLFLSAVGILYGKLGTLNMADLAAKLADQPDADLVTTTMVLFLAAFGIKAGLFPLFFWLPASYHTPANATAAVFAGLLTKVGVYALFRMFTLFFRQDPGFTSGILLFLAAATMITGVMGAAVQFNFKRILSFHIISQIGYMIFGLALMTPLALAGAIFYLIHHIVVKTNLFLVAGVVERLKGTVELKRIGGLYRQAPFLAALFFVPAFSLGGIPPLSGFWAKFSVVRAGLESQAFWVVAIALLVGMMTLYSMTKIWSEAFWKTQPGPDTRARDWTPREKTLSLGPIILLAAVTLMLGFWTQPFFQLAETAAEQLLDPSVYIRAVTEGGTGST